MTKRYIIDAHAWIEYLTATDAGKKVKTIFEENNNEIYTCAVTLAEVISKTAREGHDVETAFDILVSNSEIISVDDQLSKKAGLTHAEIQKTKKDFGLADAYVLATARSTKSKILTGDPHFRGIKDAFLITSR
jgi:predicted nucleic acid-binding protein